jgi:hypothetical protein
MSDAELTTAVDFVKGCYRVLVEIRDELRAMRRAGTPTQSALPLDDGLPVPGEVARRIAAAPRAWGNTVKAWEALFGVFGEFDVNLDAVATNTDAMRAVRKATQGQIGMSTIPRILSALVRAGAATRKGGVYTLREPNDELRDAVERVRNAKGGAK